MKAPLLYSLLRCPYAIRARMALLMAKQDVLIRSILLKNKPQALLETSPKGTVPVLVLPDGVIIDESLDIMIWALKINDPEDLLFKEEQYALPRMIEMVAQLDKELRPHLNIYKDAKRAQLEGVDELRKPCEDYIQKIESTLQKQKFLMRDRLSLADLAMFPFLRQFSNVEKKWFEQAPYPYLRIWLENQIKSDLFIKTMAKGPLWPETKEEIFFSWKV